MGSNEPPKNQIAGALTFPSRSNENAQAAPIQPRQPRNLQGLLRFAMEATKAEDAPGNSDCGPMDEERRSFLEDALRGLTVNVTDVMLRAIKVLTDQEKMESIKLGQELPEEVLNSFHNILEFVDDIDIANDFHKMGGFAIFPIAFSCENDEVRAKACSVLAELCQNNPYCQTKALECGLLHILLNLIQSERGLALTKCLYALSAMTREFQPACKELTAQGGCDILTKLLTAPEPVARTKASFLIRYLASHYREAKEQFIKLNLVKTVAGQLKQGKDSSSEHLLSTLLAMVDGLEPTVMAQCRDHTLGLKKILQEHLKHPELVGERFREERDYCQELIKVIFTNCPDLDGLDEEEADR